MASVFDSTTNKKMAEIFDRIQKESKFHIDYECFVCLWLSTCTFLSFQPFFHFMPETFRQNQNERSALPFNGIYFQPAFKNRPALGFLRFNVFSLVLEIGACVYVYTHVFLCLCLRCNSDRCIRRKLMPCFRC